MIGGTQGFGPTFGQVDGGTGLLALLGEVET